MITGSIVAIVTPMQADGSVDWAAYRRLIEWHIDSGTSAIVAVGTTGESATLNADEHVRCVEFAVKAADNRIPVLAGTGSNSTREAIYFANMAKAAGAKAHLSVAPYYNKPNQRCLLAHFRAIAEACDLPMILYNVPGRTCSDIAPETVLELAKIPHIVGIKEASTIERCRELLAACPKDFAVYSGDDPINCQIIAEGAAGAISVTANVAPKAMAAVCRLATTDFAKAKAIDNTLQALHNRLFVEPNPVPVKWALSRMGWIEERIRLPLLPLHQSHYAEVEDALSQAGITLTKTP
ncbi:MAG: 4-hydroxy-tetrahydrodipicolinate synthase [Gammaproteobacteria bacterium]|nr:MAG: 4-hydroxy-tetrahydrodipicolinate synthase [Gammaproteobacteria bacterium]